MDMVSDGHLDQALVEFVVIFIEAVLLDPVFLDLLSVVERGG